MKILVRTSSSRLSAIALAIAISVMFIIPSQPSAAEEGAGHEGAERPDPALARGPSDGELSFDGVDFAPAKDSFFVDEIYEFVKYRRFRENMSGGLTEDGINFTIDW